jgi:hypothetical protein
MGKGEGKREGREGGRIGAFMERRVTGSGVEGSCWLKLVEISRCRNVDLILMGLLG